MILKHRGPPDKILSRLKFSVFLNCCDRRTANITFRNYLVCKRYPLPGKAIPCLLRSKITGKKNNTNMLLIIFILYFSKFQIVQRDCCSRRKNISLTICLWWRENSSGKTSWPMVLQDWQICIHKAMSSHMQQTLH